MAKNRQRLDEKLKSKVALESFGGAKTLAQIASDHKTAP